MRNDMKFGFRCGLARCYDCQTTFNHSDGWNHLPFCLVPKPWDKLWSCGVSTQEHTVQLKLCSHSSLFRVNKIFLDLKTGHIESKIHNNTRTKINKRIEVSKLLFKVRGIMNVRVLCLRFWLQLCYSFVRNVRKIFLYGFYRKHVSQN